MITIKFKAKRIDNGEWVEGNYFKTPLTDENSGIESKYGWYFLSDGKTRHCISTELGVVFVVDPETIHRIPNLQLSEKDKRIKEMEGFITKLREGGEIVSSGICSALEIAMARACFRFWVDNDGFGYVYRPTQQGKEETK